MSSAAQKKQQRSYEHQLYSSPIKLAARSAGKMSIVHEELPAGKRVEVVNLRQAITRGIRPVRAMLTAPRRIHRLIERGHGVWMSDLPEELNQIGEMLWEIEPRGSVCVGGLGLGILAAVVAGLDSVARGEVLVVERSLDVLKLCDDGARHGYVCAHDDIARWLRNCARPFDFYLLDTWGPTSEGVWWNQVLPLRRAIGRRWGARRPRPVIHCWAEDMMLAQVMKKLCGDYAPHWYYKAPFRAMSEERALRFVADAGMKEWEREYGRAVNDALRSKGAE